MAKIVSFLVFFLSSLAGLWAGTQSLAVSVAFDSSVLGEPAVVLGGQAIYAPWKLFTWASSFGFEDERVRGGYLWTLLGVGLGLIGGVSFRVFSDSQREGEELTRNVYGDAAFAKMPEIRRMGLVGQGRGVFLGKTKDGQYIRHDGPEHYAIIAPTRSGKGAGIVVPTLLSWRGSAIVYDLKEENFQRTAGERSRFSDILYFNPNSLSTTRFNPLDEIRSGDCEVRDAQNIANMIIEPDRPGVHDHWIRTGNSLLTAAILHVRYAAPPWERNLNGVAKLLSCPDKTLTETLQEMLETKHIRGEGNRPLKAHPGVVSAVRDVLNKSGDDKSSVVSTVMGYLGVYRDPLLANATSCSDFSIGSLVNGERPKSLYMVIPAGDIDRLRPIIRLVVNLICRRLTERAVTGEQRDQEHLHKMLLMLDEFPALGRLEFFESALGFLAGYGLKAMLVCQSLAQLKQVYGDRSSILDNTHVRVLFRPETIETAEYISKTLGQTTVRYKTQSESGKKGSPFKSSFNESLHFGARPLLTPREVMELADDEALVMVGGGKPIRAKKIRYFDDGSFIPLLHKPPMGVAAGISPSSDEWIRTCYEAIEQDVEPLVQAVAANGEDSSRNGDTLPSAQGPALRVLKHPKAYTDLSQNDEVVNPRTKPSEIVGDLA
jgi:type IV secretion system protein VirD4